MDPNHIKPFGYIRRLEGLDVPVPFSIPKNLSMEWQPER